MKKTLAAGEKIILLNSRRLLGRHGVTAIVTSHIGEIVEAMQPDGRRLLAARHEVRRIHGAITRAGE